MTDRPQGIDSAQPQGETSTPETRPWTEPVKAVIFDMDGLIVDSEKLHMMSLRMVFRKFGIDFSDDEEYARYYQQFVGISDLDAAQIIVKEFASQLTYSQDGVEMVMEAEEWASAKQTAHQELLSENPEILRKAEMPGVRELLKQLSRQEIKMAVASGSIKDEIKQILDALGLIGYFGEHCYSVDELVGKKGKPDPAVFLYAASQLGVDPVNCLVLEDGPKGIKAAAAAGMHSYAIPSDETRGQEFPGADRVLKSLLYVPMALFENSPSTFSQQAA